MKPLQLDFSQYHARRRRLTGTLALVAVCALFAAALLQQRTLQARIAQLETTEIARTGFSGRAAQPSEADQRDLKAALDARRALNLPWESLLGALEQAQGSKVHLLGLQPNPLRGEVVLSGEAANFDALMAYLKTLRTQPVFADVVLVNQRQVEEDGRRSLAFTLAAEWKSGAP